MSPTTWGWLVLGFPLAGFLVVTFGWSLLRGRAAGWIASAAVGASFASAVGAFVSLQGRAEDAKTVVSTAFDYGSVAGYVIKLGIYVDPLAVMMMLIVSGVSFLIHVYAVGYMTSDRGFNRFFSYLNFFVFSMLLLVMASNFVFLIVGWAFVGAASYFLISFWYRRATATAAGIKAFVINVVGDVGMVFAAFFIVRELGSFDFATVFSKAPHVLGHNSGVAVAICLLLLLGAFAKSAQLPLHTWLPDAMEGPTPVSALIHAATMVTAGVYLIARTHVLFEVAPAAADVAAVVGVATLIFAGTVALVQTDMKRVIAYSTISQIGYMIMSVSVFAYAAGMFHLMTHAFFKALLFMGAGSVIGAMANEQDIDRMGGFRKAMPLTYVTFLIGSLALAGFPPFAGYFSKDDILAFTGGQGGWHWILWGLGYFGAFLTAVYAFRIVFRVFHGEPCEQARELAGGHLHHAEQPFNPANHEIEDTEVGFPGPHHQIAERSSPMRLAMIALAVLTAIGGAIQIPFVDSGIENFLRPTFEPPSGGSAIAPAPDPSNTVVIVGLIVGALIAALGIGVAAYLYLRATDVPARLQARFAGLHRFLYNKWYFDELYDAGVVRPAAALGRFAQRVVERYVIQGLLVGGPTALARLGSAAVRSLQSGYLRSYALLLLGGVGAIGLYFLIQSSV